MAATLPPASPRRNGLASNATACIAHQHELLAATGFCLGSSAELATQQQAGRQHRHAWRGRKGGAAKIGIRAADAWTALTLRKLVRQRSANGMAAGGKRVARGIAGDACTGAVCAVSTSAQNSAP